MPDAANAQPQLTSPTSSSNDKASQEPAKPLDGNARPPGMASNGKSWKAPEFRFDREQIIGFIVIGLMFLLGTLGFINACTKSRKSPPVYTPSSSSSHPRLDLPGLEGPTGDPAKDVPAFLRTVKHDRQMDIRPGQYYSVEVSLNQTQSLYITVVATGSAAADVSLMRISEASKFRKGQTYMEYKAFSGKQVRRQTFQGMVYSGNYLLVIKPSSFATTTADVKVEVF